MNERDKFATAIAEAALHNDFNAIDCNSDYDATDETRASPSGPRSRRPANELVAQKEADAAFAKLAAQLAEKHNCGVVWAKPRITRKKSSAEYGFWKKPVLAFIETPETLDLGPTELARQYAPTELNFVVTTDTFRAPLSRPARKAAGALLKSRGYALNLPSNFSIRDIQIAMKDHRDRAMGVETYSAAIEIVGDTVYCDGKGYKVQPTASGKRRIRVGNGWLSLERLIAFLSSQPQ